jgi:hypothetical protein
MKKYIAIIILLTLPTTDILAQDRVMMKFDDDQDGYLTPMEIAGKCKIKPGLFKHADKNKDGLLSRGEMRKGGSYLFRSETCRKLVRG